MKHKLYNIFSHIVTLFAGCAITSNNNVHSHEVKRILAPNKFAHSPFCRINTTSQLRGVEYVNCEPSGLITKAMMCTVPGSLNG